MRSSSIRSSVLSSLIISSGGLQLLLLLATTRSSSALIPCASYNSCNVNPSQRKQLQEQGKYGHKRNTALSFTSTAWREKPPISPFVLRLNRIFAELDECVEDEHGSLSLQLSPDDYRSKHIEDILQLKEGDTIKTGVLNLGVCDHGRIEKISVGRPKKKGGFEKGTEGPCLYIGEKSELASQTNYRPRVDILLAVPRPLRLERILTVVAMMGVGRIILIDAEKVEKDFFGSHLFRRPEEMRKCFIEGLSQSAVDCMVPEILVRRKQDKFLIQELEDLYPLESTVRVIAHPFKDGAGNARQNIFGLSREKLTSSNSSKLLIAIGPEGGWSSVEIDKFISKYSFQQVDMGNRILRTDVAITSVLALAHQLMQTIEVECGHH